MGKYLKLFENHNQYTAFTQTEEFVKPNVSHCIQENEVHYNPIPDPRIIAYFNVSDASSLTTICGNMPQAIEIDGENISIEELVTNMGGWQLGTGEHIIKYTLVDPTVIPRAMFDHCSSVTRVDIPDNVISIEDYVFSDCTQLETLNIGKGVSTITVANTFFGCNSLVNIVIDEGNKTFDSRDNCNAIIETVTNKLFRGTHGTVIPDSVTSIGDSAFSALGLTSFTVPEGITSIGYYALAQNYDLATVTLPSTLEYMDKQVFQLCYGLTSITSLATTAPTIEQRTFMSVSKNGTLYVPQGSTGYDVWMGTGDYYLGKYSWTKVEQ